MSKTIKLVVVYGLLVVMAVLLVLGFTIQKSFNPEIEAPYTIYITSTTGQEVHDGGDIKNSKERYDEIYAIFEDSMKQSFMSALFSGNLSYEPRIEYVGLENKLSFSGYKMLFKYAEEQTIMLDGKEYAHKTASSEILKYTRVYFDVVQTNGMAKVAMYYEVPTVVNETNQTVYYKRLVIANFDDLYQAIVDAI